MSFITSDNGSSSGAAATSPTVPAVAPGVLGILDIPPPLPAFARSNRSTESALLVYCDERLELKR